METKSNPVLSLISHNTTQTPSNQSKVMVRERRGKRPQREQRTKNKNRNKIKNQNKNKREIKTRKSFKP